MPRQQSDGTAREQAKQAQHKALRRRVSNLEKRGVTKRRDQAKALKLPYSTFMRHLSEAQMTTERVSLRDWMLGPIAEEHHGHPYARHLRYLAQAAQSRETSLPGRRAAAITWARGLVDKGLDVAYSREDGFTTPNAAGSAWYLKDVLTAAEKYVYRDTAARNLSDLGENPN